VLLLIEVSDTTTSWDRTMKRPLYAAAGINEMWIVDLSQRMIEVASEPGPDGYRNIVQVAPDKSVTPLALPDVTIPVTALFS
jgi:Uma2 family endonuclease